MQECAQRLLILILPLFATACAGGFRGSMTINEPTTEPLMITTESSLDGLRSGVSVTTIGNDTVLEFLGDKGWMVRIKNQTGYAGCFSLDLVSFQLGALFVVASARDDSGNGHLVITGESWEMQKSIDPDKRLCLVDGPSFSYVDN